DAGFNTNAAPMAPEAMPGQRRTKRRGGGQYSFTAHILATARKKLSLCRGRHCEECRHLAYIGGARACSHGTHAESMVCYMSETESVPVTYRVLNLERVIGAGRLIGVANCEVDIAGVVIVLQGVQLRRGADGSLSCTAPQWRHPRTGQWLPAVIL